MKHLSVFQLLRCLFIAVFSLLVFFLLLLGGFAVYGAAPALRAPWALLFQRETLGRKIGEITVLWNGEEKLFKVYSSKRDFTNSRSSKTGKCLLLYPRYSVRFFSGKNAFKVTEDSFGIFNDSPLVCLSVGNYFYECERSLPVYSVDDDMKGLGTPFRIERTADAVSYSIPSKRISFTIPLAFFASLKE